MKSMLKNLLVFALIAMLAVGSVLPVSAEDTATIDPDRAVASVFGDANLDGKVNIKDATGIQKLIAKIIHSDEISELLADVNEDKKVNIKDATEIQKWLAKLSSIDKIGMPLEQENETSPSTQPHSTTNAITTENTETPSASVESSTATETLHQTDPVESETASQAFTTSATDDSQKTTEVTEATVGSVATDPTEEQKPEETLPESSEGEEKPEAELYKNNVMDIFAQQGFDPYESGMFYKVIYCYYGDTTTYRIAPEYVLIWASIGAVADEAFEYTIGDYVLKCSGHCYPYDLGYYIYIPSTDNLMTIEDAYMSNLKGLKTVFEEAPVFRSVKVDFKIIDEVRINYYGSEETELYLLRHSSAEEAVTSKFTEGFFDVPELNLPKDENGFYYDKIYLVSLNVVGGGNASQWIYKITVEGGVLTVYRSINQPQNQTPDMNYQYVLIELDASLSESIYILEDVREVYTIGG